MSKIYDIDGNLMYEDNDLTIKELVVKNKSNLKRADLFNVNLSGVNLSYADLSNSNLSFTSLIKADLTGTNLSIFSKWSISYLHPDKDTKFKDVCITIGCKMYAIKRWDKWFKSNEEFETKRNTQDFKKIKAIYKAYKYYIKDIHFS